VHKPETSSYQEQYKDTTIAVSPFVLRSTGIIPSQTSLKVDTYTLVCVPYQLAMSRTVLMGSFTKDEIVFFQRFKGALAGLTLMVAGGQSKEPEKIFCRCQISAVGLMKDRDRVGLIICDFKPIPPALAQILGEHLRALDRLTVAWNDFRDKPVQVNPESSSKLGYNNYAVMAFGAERCKVALYSLAVNRLDCLMPLNSPDLAAETPVAISLYFQKHRFTVTGRINAAHHLPSGVQKLRVSLDFSPELCDIMSEFFLAPAEPKNGAGQP
jgi:hypothetical protein